MQAIFIWLFESLIFLGVIAVLMFIGYSRRPAEANLDDHAQFAIFYLKKNWKWLLPGVVFWLFGGYVAGLVVMGLAWALLYFVPKLPKLFGGSTTRKIREWEDRIASEHREWLASLGARHEERVSAINRMFDRKDKTLSISRIYKFKESNREGTSIKRQVFLAFRISRNLAAMETREREFLRIVELMHSLADGKDQQSYILHKFGLLWGNGKATIDSYYYSMMDYESKGIRDGLTAVNWFTSLTNASVDSVVNDVLQSLEAKASGAAQDPRLAALLKDIKGRIMGGNAWLAADEVPETVFAPKGDHALRIGLLDGTETPLTYSGEGSLITIAAPGSGKTQCNVFPNLLSWRGPAVVLDVKGEIYAGTSRWRAENVGPVYKFSPLDPAKSHCYNPLSFIRQETDYVWEDSRFLADMMIVPSGATDPFWESKARDVLTAAIAHVCYYSAPDQRPMSQVIDIVHGGKPWDQMVVGLQAATDVRAMVQQGTSLAGMSEKTRDGVLQTAQSSLSAWSGERISRATQRSDWSPLDLRGGKNPTIYICLKPSEVESYISLLRVFIAQHIRMLTSELPARGAAPILFLLDELPRLRQMPPVEEAIEIGRQYGLRLWMFAQSLGQLEKAYPNAEGMVGSCAVRIFMNPSAHDGLAEKLSEELGYREAALDGSRQKIVEPAELAGPAYRDYQLVMAASCKPAKVMKAFAWQDPDITQRMGSL